MGKSKRLVTVTAGRIGMMVCYSQAVSSDSEHVREQKSRVSSEARKKLNQKYSWQKLEMLLAANFPAGKFVTLTYDEEHLPESRKEATANMKRYIRLLRRRWRLRGKELKYIFCTEGRHGDARFHHHIVLNAEAADEEDLRSLWTGGENTDVQSINVRDGYEALAQYMTKESRVPGMSPVGARTWSPSKNLTRPTRTSFMVDSGTTLTAPEQARILSREMIQNGWGEYEYIKYLLP